MLGIRHSVHRLLDSDRDVGLVARARLPPRLVLAIKFILSKDLVISARSSPLLFPLLIHRLIYLGSEFPAWLVL